MEDTTFARQREEDLQRLRGFRLLDDDFMTKVFEVRHVLSFSFASS